MSGCYGVNGRKTGLFICLLNSFNAVSPLIFHFFILARACHAVVWLETNDMVNDFTPSGSHHQNERKFHAVKNGKYIGPFKG